MTPSSDAARHRRGLAITGLGGLALSFDIPLIRSADGEVWSILAVRSLSTFAVAIAAWLFINRVLGRRIALIPGKAGLIAGLFYGINSFTFLLAVFNTSTANVVFILAFTSMFAAILSWIFLKERPSNATLLTMAIMLLGVGVIVQDGLESGHLFGDAMAACSAFLLASAITISRASGRDMALVPLTTAIFPALAALTLLPASGFAIAAPGYILFNGLVMIPVAFFCLATGPRYLSAPEVGMFYLLETILAPIWVWIVFSEMPTFQTLVGGAILILALLGHSLWQMRSKAAKAEIPCEELPFTG
ncbi:DMT family transporter [Sinorhizobium americanum]|uniref:EamA domain-containing membrane protein RarD n=1 Tax=Sinorhizobium americanum TaxID=194963 RepID=A0A4R2BVK3_9HYPH|nr:DMT family transporter [Sinorhizobium americanum]TCN30972.1 EamA domain-containing membrane protein RarD [Sinorhizobium americanum]